MTIVYGVGRGLYVNLTNRCPCACTFCIRNNSQGAYGSDPLWLEREPEVEEVAEAIDNADLTRYDELVFCGFGEPTERLDALLAVAEHVKGKYPGFPVRVNTNGLSDLINGSPTAHRFAGLVDTVSVSLNASNALDYMATCRPRFGEKSYEAMLRFAQDAVKFVPKVVMSVVASPDMEETKIAECARICESLGLALRVREYAG